MLEHNNSEQRPLIQELTDEETDQVEGGLLIAVVGLAIITVAAVNKYARVEHW